MNWVCKKCHLYIERCEDMDDPLDKIWFVKSKTSEKRSIWCDYKPGYCHVPMTNLEYLEYQDDIKALRKFYASK